MINIDGTGEKYIYAMNPNVSLTPEGRIVLPQESLSTIALDGTDLRVIAPLKSRNIITGVITTDGNVVFLEHPDNQPGNINTCDSGGGNCHKLPQRFTFGITDWYINHEEINYYNPIFNDITGYLMWR